MKKRTMNDYEVLVRSERLSTGELESAKHKVQMWRNNGHSSMAIMYFLGQQNNYSVSEYIENEKVVITIH